MNTYNDIQSKISRKLLSQRWLLRYGLNKDIMEQHIKSTYFSQGLTSLLEDEDYSCSRVLKLCLPLLKLLCNGEEPENWLEHIYSYTLSRNFPEALEEELNPNLNLSCEVYLRLLRIVDDFQKLSEDNSWQSDYPMSFLSPEEEKALEYPSEYNAFMKSFKQDYVYEMMKLHMEVTGYNTLDHVCGVHYLSLYIARQLKELGLPLDLGRVSGAAAAHDIGKYACRGVEIKRVPYLHYYYTDLWFSKRGIIYIGNIAVNHSTWDLEFENLSLESLILIYSDFRVKNRYRDGRETMHLFTLKESFKVILDKLDNVDEAKRRRYRRVYCKLADFEDYLVSLGVNTQCPPKASVPSNPLKARPSYSLLMGEQIIEELKHLSIDHNIHLMYELRDEYALDTILEHARSEKDWKNLREYIRIFEEYTTYLTQNQKLQTIKFLYENTIHPEDDIRRHCAELMGNLIALYDEEYKKELPADVVPEENIPKSLTLFESYLDLFLFPTEKLAPAHRSWMGYSLSFFVQSFFAHCSKKMLPKYREILLNRYREKSYKSSEVQLFLLENIKYIPLEPFIEEDFIQVFDFLLSSLNKNNSTIRIEALEVIAHIAGSLPSSSTFREKIVEYLKAHTERCKVPAENYLKMKVCSSMGISELKPIFEINFKKDERLISDIFLSNLKTATEWIKKKIQVKLLLEQAMTNPRINPLHTAIHFCNLLKVSAVESVRSTAGFAILTLMPKLTLPERNEVAVELLRALEIEGHRFTEYIPPYLGQIILYLQPKEANEIIEDLMLKVKLAKPPVKALILKTIAIAISNYAPYRERFMEAEEEYEARLKNMLGILLNGLGDYNVQVQQAAFSTLGKDIFGSKALCLNEKKKLFLYLAKKLLTLNTEKTPLAERGELLFLANAVALNSIYRFISDYSFNIGEISLSVPEKVAFFPGTFDPFSTSHKEIAKNIRNLGYEVYLAVDEFSWSKKTLPNELRRKIINMSVAEELDIYLYPEKYPINISNSQDLLCLRESFSPCDVYMVVGSDVILNASSYKAVPGENSIHSFSHIIFERGSNKKLREAAKVIRGEVKWLTLPSKFLDISSTQIRNYIDENRDISILIDPMAQQYIYDNGFYQREPQDKASIKSLSLKTEVINEASDSIVEKLTSLLPFCTAELHKVLLEHRKKDSGRIMLLIDDNSKEEILGFAMFHWARSSNLYHELKDVVLSQHVRDVSFGRILMIDVFYVKNNDKNKNLEQILLTETLAFAIARDYEFAIFRNMYVNLCSSNISDLLVHYGFTKLPSQMDSAEAYMVNMSNPCVLNFDVENLLKEPFRSNNRVRAAIAATRKRLQEALCNLYPGELILPFDSAMLHQTMIRKICQENGVPKEVLNPRTLGTDMCVPYGDILHRYVIPNTVTKALHTEKYFEPAMDSFFIAESPYYLNLETQVKTLKSFNRSVILVDNILHKGYRMKALDPLFKKENIVVKKILTGILSGRGRDLMDMQHREVDSIYFIPRLKLWFNENALYPFIGGDSLWRGSFPVRNLLPSINLILPYTSPKFIENASRAAVYELSKVCLKNSLHILSVLEEEYHQINERNLCLASLGQVFTVPRCPDKGVSMRYDLSLSPSHYLKNDYELLDRLEQVIL